MVSLKRLEKKALSVPGAAERIAEIEAELRSAVETTERRERTSRCKVDDSEGPGASVDDDVEES